MALPTDYTPTENDRAHAERCMEQARLLAATYLPELLTTMVEKALDPTATPKVVLDAADFTYRVSGMAKKQEDKPAGPGFSITINIPSQGKEIVIGGGAAKEPSNDARGSVAEVLACLPEIDIESFDPRHAEFDFVDPTE